MLIAHPQVYTQTVQKEELHEGGKKEGLMESKPNYSIIAFRIIGFAFIYTGSLLYTVLLDCVDELFYTWMFAAVAIPALVPPVLVLSLFKTGTAYRAMMALVALVVTCEGAYLAWLLITIDTHLENLEDSGNILAYIILVATVSVRVFFLSWVVILMESLRFVPLEQRLFEPAPASAPTTHKSTVEYIEVLAYTYAVLVGGSFLLRFNAALSYTHFMVFLVLPVGLPIIMAMAIFKRKRSLTMAIFFIAAVTVSDILFLVFLFSSYEIHKADIDTTPHGYLSYVFLVVLWVLRMIVGLIATSKFFSLYRVPFGKRIGWLLKTKVK